jgi:Arc/MetJ-type ribon-helix-helix transcriptional regulator
MSMTITLKPETERLVQEELKSGHFHSVDEIIMQGLQARRQKEPQPQGKSFRLAPGTKTPAEAGEDIRQLRRGNRLPPGVTIRDLIDEGRA